MTREEQIEQARKLAERNPEWRLATEREESWLEHASGMDVYTNWDGRWIARRVGVALRGANKRLRLFESPAAAIRALGFEVDA